MKLLRAICLNLMHIKLGTVFTETHDIIEIKKSGNCKMNSIKVSKFSQYTDEELLYKLAIYGKPIYKYIFIYITTILIVTSIISSLTTYTLSTNHVVSTILIWSLLICDIWYARLLTVYNNIVSEFKTRGIIIKYINYS